MNQLHDNALRGIGTVAVAHTILDFGCRALLKRFVLAGLVRAKDHLTVGGQLMELKKPLQDPRLVSMAPRLIEWFEAADAANKERNRVIHDPMFYGDATSLPGLAQMRSGEAQLVDPQQLEALRQTLTELGMTGAQLAAEVAILLGQEIEQEEEEGAA